MTSAAGVTVSTAPFQEAGPGSTPRAALQQIRVEPVPMRLAQNLLVREHYLHSLPGGTKLAFGVLTRYGRWLGFLQRDNLAMNGTHCFSGQYAPFLR